MATTRDAPVAPDPGPERAEDGGRRGADDRPTLPYAKAFVVQFGVETDARLEHVAGRIEHLQTGRRARFRSIEDLLVCLGTMLGEIEASAERAEGEERSW